MKFMFFILPTVPGSLEDRKNLRPIGRNTERYQQMLEEMRNLAVLADEAGFDVFATTEHHFHSEGYETSVAPLLIYADLAARTSRISFAPLGLCLPAWDPIRAAEELAILDQLTRGRVYAGFARGYQDRWMQVMAQMYRASGAPMDQGEQDLYNRRVGEEVFHVIRKAWTEETLEYNGEFYQVPFPHETGIRRWPAQEWTNTYGAPGELDEEGVVRRVCVVPGPYQDPHPRLFQPFSVSEKTIRWTAEEDIVPWILTAYPPRFRELCQIYQSVAAENGRQLALGQGVGAVKAIHFGDTEDEAVNLLRETNYAGFYHYFGGFGFWEAFRSAEDEEKYPLDPFTPLPVEEWTVDRMRNVKYALAGTPDQVKREVADLHSVYDGGDLEWLAWFFDQGLMPWEEQVRQVEFFAKHVIAEFR